MKYMAFESIIGFFSNNSKITKQIVFDKIENPIS